MTVGGGVLGGCAGLLLAAVVIDGGDNSGETAALMGLVGMGLGVAIGWSASKPNNVAGLINFEEDALALAMPDVAIRPGRKGTEYQMTMMNISF